MTYNDAYTQTQIDMQGRVYRHTYTHIITFNHVFIRILHCMQALCILYFSERARAVAYT